MYFNKYPLSTAIDKPAKKKKVQIQLPDDTKRSSRRPHSRKSFCTLPMSHISLSRGPTFDSRLTDHQIEHIKSDVEGAKNFMIGFKVCLPEKKTDEPYQIMLPGNLELVLPELPDGRRSQVQINVMTLCSQVDPVDFDFNEGTSQVYDVNNPIIDEIIGQLNNYVRQVHYNERGDRKASATETRPFLVSRKPQVQILYTNNITTDRKSTNGLHFHYVGEGDNSVYSKLENAAKTFSGKIGSFFKSFDQNKIHSSSSESSTENPQDCQWQGLLDSDVSSADNLQFSMSTEDSEMMVRKTDNISKKKRRKLGAEQIDNAALYSTGEVKNDRSEATLVYVPATPRPGIVYQCTKSTDSFLSGCNIYSYPKVKKNIRTMQKFVESMFNRRKDFRNKNMRKTPLNRIEKCALLNIDRIPQQLLQSDSTDRIKKILTTKTKNAINLSCELLYKMNKFDVSTTSNENSSTVKKLYSQSAETTPITQIQKQLPTHMLLIRKCKHTDMTMQFNENPAKLKIENDLLQKRGNGIMLKRSSGARDFTAEPSLSVIFIAEKFATVLSGKSKTISKPHSTLNKGTVVGLTHSNNTDKCATKENKEILYLYLRNANQDKQVNSISKKTICELPIKQKTNDRKTEKKKKQHFTIVPNVLADINRNSYPRYNYMFDSIQSFYVYQIVNQKYQNLFGKPACCVHNIPKSISADSNTDVSRPKTCSLMWKQTLQKGEIGAYKNGSSIEGTTEQVDYKKCHGASYEDGAIPEMHFNFTSERATMLHVNNCISLHTDADELSELHKNCSEQPREERIIERGSRTSQPESNLDISNNRSLIRIEKNDSFCSINNICCNSEQFDVSTTSSFSDNLSLFCSPVSDQSVSHNNVNVIQDPECFQFTGNSNTGKTSSKELDQINSHSKKINNIYKAPTSTERSSLLDSTNHNLKDKRPTIYTISSKSALKQTNRPTTLKNPVESKTESSSYQVSPSGNLDYVVRDDTFKVKSVIHELPINIQIYGINKRDEDLLHANSLKPISKCKKSLVDVIFCRELNSHPSVANNSSFGGASLKNMYIVKNDNGSHLHISNSVPVKPVEHVLDTNICSTAKSNRSKPFAVKHLIANAMRDMLMHFSLNTSYRQSLCYDPPLIREETFCESYSPTPIDCKTSHKEPKGPRFISEARIAQNLAENNFPETRTTFNNQSLRNNHKWVTAEVQSVSDPPNDHMSDANKRSKLIASYDVTKEYRHAGTGKCVEQKNYPTPRELESKPNFLAELRNDFRPTETRQAYCSPLDKTEPLTLFLREAVSTCSSDFSWDKYEY